MLERRMALTVEAFVIFVILRWPPLATTRLGEELKLSWTMVQLSYGHSYSSSGPRRIEATKHRAARRSHLWYLLYYAHRQTTHHLHSGHCTQNTTLTITHVKHMLIYA